MGMMDRLIRFSLTHRGLVLACGLLLLGFGGYSALRMPVDVFPDLTAPTVTVITEAYGMAPLEVESQVTLPIESAVNGAPGVRRVRSASAVGLSIIWVEFDWGTEAQWARQLVNEKLRMASGRLPMEVGQPLLSPETSIMGEVMFLALTSDRHTPTEMHTFADTVLERRLLAVPGVAKVTPTGGGERQFQVLAFPERLTALGVTVGQVAEALRAGSENTSAGFINERGMEYLVTGVGRYRSIADIGSTVVVVRGGVGVTVGDLGEVRMGESPRRGEACANGRPAVLIGVSKQPGANTLELTRELDRVLDGLERRLPEGMELNRQIFRQADFISVAVANVERALMEGVVLVVLVVLVFLGNVRATLITVLAIPLSLVAAVLVLQGFGATLNTMTLGGMAIAIGALVDDAVIDVENVFRRLRENERLEVGRRRATWDVVYDASVEIRRSIVYATLIIALVFVPLLFLAGVEGRLMRPLGVAYLVALLASLGVAMTVTPVLCYLLLPGSRAVRVGDEPRLVRWLKHGYGIVLDWSLPRPGVVMGLGALLLVAALASVPWMGRSFLPEFNEGSLTITTATLPGTGLEESARLAHLVDEVLLGHPEVVNVGRRTGRAELDEHSLGVELSEIEVSLRPGARSRLEFQAVLRGELGLIPGLAVTIGQPISHRIDHMLSGTRASIAAKVFGPDLYRLRELGERVREAMSEVVGVVDLSLEAQVEVPTLLVRFDRPALARYGLRVRDVSETLQAAINGLVVGSVLESEQAVDVVLRLVRPPLPASGFVPVSWRTDTLGDVHVDLPAGGRVPLSAVARILKATGPNVVSREQVERKIVVSANVAGRDVASVVRDCERVVEGVLAEMPGYRVEFGGQFQSAVEAGRLLMWLGLAVVMGIGLLLHLAFGTVRDTVLVMLNLPLALIGGVVGVFISGGVLSVASLIGFITVFGIATRNGIMLVLHIRHLQSREGVLDFRRAVVRGAVERLAPIWMTALATGLALVPLALGGGKPGSEIETPMAIVILFGLMSSMLLNMVVVPVLYLRYGRPVLRAGGER
jgi:CzcA family heavy metal efflux pump